MSCDGNTQYPLDTCGNTSSRDTTLESCAWYHSLANQQIELTMKLDKPHRVDAVLVIAENHKDHHLSEFYIYVGYSNNWQENTECQGGPYAHPTDAKFQTYTYNNWQHTGSHWSNGAEVWCGIEGTYVSFIRKADAVHPLAELRLVEFSPIANRAHIP